MTSKIIEKHNEYYCSNCMMRQQRIRASCWWCGNLFSNYEEMLIKDYNERIKNLADGGIKDEDNLYGGN